MTDQEALIAAIIANPADDTARLVYADCLDENAGESEAPCVSCAGTGWDDRGRTKYVPPVYQCRTCLGEKVTRTSNGYAERAEFIRVQVELERTPGCTYSKPTWNAEHKPGLCPWCDLRRRERELLAIGRNSIEWRGDLVNRIPSGKSQFTRGFISEIECNWMSWLAHADAIRTAQPIERVKLRSRPYIIVTNERITRIYEPQHRWTRLIADWNVIADPEWVTRGAHHEKFSRTFVISDREYEAHDTRVYAEEHFIRMIALDKTPEGYCRMKWPKIAFEMPREEYRQEFQNEWRREWEYPLPLIPRGQWQAAYNESAANQDDIRPLPPPGADYDEST